MKRRKCTHELIPIQPYLEKTTANYKSITMNKYGIAHFYEFTMNADVKTRLKAVPDGSVDLSFAVGKNVAKPLIGGTVLKAKKWVFQEDETYFGIRFLPGQCLLPDGIAIHEIIDEDLEIQGKCYQKDLAEILAHTAGIRKRAEIFMEAYLENVASSHKDRSAEYLLEKYIKSKIYASKGKINIRELAQETGFSECYVRRIFGRIHGVSPKTFERFVRFQYLLQDMNQAVNHIELEEMALEHGYYDQSHMSNEFKCYAGVTPEAYLKKMR